MITLTKDAVFAAARKAYEEGQLSAQGPNPQCRYRDTVGLPCAVGAAVDPDELTKENRERFFENEIGSVGSLSFRKLFNIPSREQEMAILALQASHDAWASAERRARNEPAGDVVGFVEKSKKSFVDLLYGEEDNG